MEGGTATHNVFIKLVAMFLQLRSLHRREGGREGGDLHELEGSLLESDGSEFVVQVDLHEG
jgi:hypothetical protein